MSRTADEFRAERNQYNAELKFRQGCWEMSINDDTTALLMSSGMNETGSVLTFILQV